MEYQIKYPSKSIWYKINGLSIHVRHWSRPGQPKVLMLHGWMDCSASFQFIVDYLSEEWDIYAMDWRGMGCSEHLVHGYYDRAVMLSDLAQLVDLLCPESPIHLLGHSLGSMLLSLYAGAFPSRVKSVILAEGFGVAEKDTLESVQYMNTFLKEIARGKRRFPVKSRQDYVQKLIHNNPLLSYPKALYLSEYLLTERAGQLVLSADIKHRISQPFFYNLSFYQPFWQSIQCPILWIEGDFVPHNVVLNNIKDSLETRYKLLGEPSRVKLYKAGHMIHWEASEEMADTIQKFLVGFLK